LYKPSTKPYYVFKITTTKKTWSYLVMNPILTTVSNSARVIDLKDTDICLEEVTVNIGGYHEDISVYISVLSLISSYVKDKTIMDDIKTIIHILKQYTGGLYINYSGSTVFDFNCSKNFIHFKPVKDIYVGELIHDKYSTYLNYNEFRRFMNGFDIEDSDISFIHFKIPAFVLFHLLTHTELSFIVSRGDNKIWFPEDMNNKDISVAMNLIKDGKFEEVRDLLKHLGYKKEIYNRYPNFAIVYDVEMMWRPKNKNGLEHLMIERNVINYNKKNWTQKETTDILEQIYDKILHSED